MSIGVSSFRAGKQTYQSVLVIFSNRRCTVTGMFLDSWILEPTRKFSWLAEMTIWKDTDEGSRMGAPAWMLAVVFSGPTKKLS